MSIVKNTLKLTLAYIISKILSFFWNIYITRLFTDDLSELGVYMFIITQFSIFSIIAEFNISYSVQHFISIDHLSQKKAIEEYWTFSFMSKLIISIIISIILFSVVVLQFPDYMFSAILISVNLLIYNIGTSPSPLFICFDKFNPLVISNILNVFVFTLSGVILLYLFKDINSALIGMLIGNIFHTIYMLYQGFDDFGLVKKFDKLKIQFYNILVKFSLPVAIFTFCSSLIYRIDFNIFGLLIDSQLIVYLSFATMCFFIMFDLLWSQFGVAFTPDLLRKWSSNEKSIRDKVFDQFELLFVIFTIITVLVIIGLKFLGNYFFIFLLGSEGDFYKIVPLLNNLILSTPYLLGFSFLYRIYLIEYSSLKIMIYALIFTTLKFILTYYLLPVSLLFEYSTLITSILMLFVCIALMTMKSLINYRLKMLSFFLKTTTIVIALFFFSRGFETYYNLLSNVIISLLLILITIIFFRHKLIYVNKYSLKNLFKFFK